MTKVKTKLNLKFRRRLETKTVILEIPAPAGRIPRIARLMALAIHFDELILTGQVSGQSELAQLVYVTQPRMTQIMNLLHLAPDIQMEILGLSENSLGRAPVNEKSLRSVCSEVDWAMQRRSWRRSRDDSLHQRVATAANSISGQHTPRDIS